MKKWLLIATSALFLLVVAVVLSYDYLTGGVEFGGEPLIDRVELLAKSKNFSEGRFHNTVKERDSDLWVNIKDLYHAENQEIPAKFPLVKPQYSEKVDPGLRAVWFGHASVLVEIDGLRVFFDPMLSEYAFPFQIVAPKRMNPPPLALADLPKIDAVMISHDHYDHLDMKTVRHLAQQGTSLFVGYGVGAHLERWGVPKEQIYEMKWGDTVEFKGLSFNCTEARHYSGRRSMNSNTLWVSWVVKGPEHSVFHSGDSGYSDHFRQIGKRFENIDLSLIKVGDYGLDPQWQDIHMVPEDSVQAHIDLGAKTMLPIHWGVFDLSNHPWNEPIERTLASAKEHGIDIITPMLGEAFQSGQEFQSKPWWRALENSDSPTPDESN